VIRTPSPVRTFVVAASLAVGGLGLASGFAVAPALAQAQPSEQGPQELMDSVAKRMLGALDENRAAIRKDPAKVYPIVNDILLPHFDTDYAAQLVLAQHWRTATPEQRKRFVDAFYNALLKTYGGALSDFTADRLKMQPFRGDPAATQATVRTVVTRANGQEIPVDYRLRKTANGWKAFDVIIEGISYVRNYRNDLGNEVSQKGLDAVIVRLERDGLDAVQTGNATPKTAAATTSPAGAKPVAAKTP
jgi:phospholipid transport system substrate-binding protein